MQKLLTALSLAANIIVPIMQLSAGRCRSAILKQTTYFNNKIATKCGNVSSVKQKEL